LAGLLEKLPEHLQLAVATNERLGRCRHISSRSGHQPTAMPAK
jgi:hypothetical protein